MRKKIRDTNIKIEYSFVKVLTGSDLSSRRLPIMSVKSINSGPTIWLTAGVHGEEVGGMVVIQEIFKKLKNNLLRGEVYALPLADPIGFETSSRVIVQSEEDLNRSFPGDKDGSLAERMADRIFTTITKTNPDLVLDLHNDWRKSIPYVVLDNVGQSKEIYNKNNFFAHKTGFPVILDTDDVEKTLTESLVKHNIPAFVMELGESFVVNEKNVGYGVNAIWNVLSYLGMVNPVECLSGYNLNESVKGKILKYSSNPVSHSSGVIRFLVKPGDIIEKGTPVAKVYNAFGKLLEVLRVQEKAIVLGYSDYSVAFPGAHVVSFGVI